MIITVLVEPGSLEKTDMMLTDSGIIVNTTFLLRTLTMNSVTVKVLCSLRAYNDKWDYFELISKQLRNNSK